MNRGLSNTRIENQNLTEKIRVIHIKSKQTCGFPRVTQELYKLDVKVSRPRVARLMKKAEIRSIVKRNFVSQRIAAAADRWELAEEIFDFSQIITDMKEIVKYCCGKKLKL